MGTIKLVTEQEASPEVREVYEDAKRHWNIDFVPRALQAMAHNPEVLKMNWEGMKQTEAGWGKEMFYMLSLAVDVANGCDYCINFDAAVLKQIGWDDQKVEQLVNFVAMAGMWNTYVTGLQLEPDLTPEMMGRRAA